MTAKRSQMGPGRPGLATISGGPAGREGGEAGPWGGQRGSRARSEREAAGCAGPAGEVNGVWAPAWLWGCEPGEAWSARWGAARRL